MLKTVVLLNSFMEIILKCFNIYKKLSLLINLMHPCWIEVLITFKIFLLTPNLELLCMCFLASLFLKLLCCLCDDALRSCRVAIRPLLMMIEVQIRFLADKRRSSVWLGGAWPVAVWIRWAANQTAARRIPTCRTAVTMRTARPLRASGHHESHLCPPTVTRQIKFQPPQL